MSAYICNPEHVAALAAYAATARPYRATISEWSDPHPFKAAANVARGLMLENIRSVATRYPSDKDGDRPGPTGMSDAQLLSRAAEIAKRYCIAPPPLSPVSILKMCDGLEYQSSEARDFRDTMAARQIDRIRGTAISHLPGYDSAPWSFEDADADKEPDGKGRPILLSSLMLSKRKG